MSQRLPPYPECPIPPIYRPFIDALYDWLYTERSIEGPGVYISDLPDGQQFSTVPGGAGSIGGPTAPFQVTIKNFPDAAGKPHYKRIVSGNSTLLQSLDYTDTLDVSGIASDDPPKNTDAAWKTTSNTDAVWLVVDVDATVTPPTFSNAIIKSFALGDTYDGKEVQNDGGSGSPTVFTQTKMRIMLATMTGDDKGNPIIDTQFVARVLRIEWQGYAKSFDSSGTANEAMIWASYFY